MGRQAAILGAGAAVLLVSAWLFAGARGVAVVSAGLAYGWMVRQLTPQADRPRESDVLPAQEAAADRLLMLESRTSSLRHDLRGILSPALLTAERLLGYEDPVVRRAGEIMVQTVERASTRLAETKA